MINILKFLNQKTKSEKNGFFTTVRLCPQAIKRRSMMRKSPFCTPISTISGGEKAYIGT